MRAATKEMLVVAAPPEMQRARFGVLLLRGRGGRI
jgi:hypothetical protein